MTVEEQLKLALMIQSTDPPRRIHVYEVGRPYRPDRKVGSKEVLISTIEGVSLSFSCSLTDHLRVRSKQSRPRLPVCTIRSKRLGLLCYWFDGKRQEVPWSDAPYFGHLVPSAERIQPPDPTTLTPESRTLLHVVLVNAVGGQSRPIAP